MPSLEGNSVERAGGPHPYFVDYAGKNFAQNTRSRDVWGRGAPLPDRVLEAVYWGNPAPTQPSPRMGAIAWAGHP
ncbi:hypothetical protein [Pendulispora albinea]|uniref:Uncharacterized protein n=1 Tax=Pendulispora albinea TaxID=2741071 RepID=A0ABZ2M176_9BACT